MKAIFQNHATLLFTLLLFGVLSTLVLDFWATDEVRLGTWVEELFLWIACFFRIVTFATLFIGCRLIAEELSGSANRTILLASIWSLIGLSLAAMIWCHLAFAEEIHSGGAIRFTPDRPNETLDEVILSARASGAYTWKSAITREAIGIVTISIIIAYFLAFMGKSGRFGAAYFAPFVFVIGSQIYAIIAPWSFAWRGYSRIGDALIGAMDYNSLFIVDTLVYGGLTGPAVWVSLIAISNLVLLNLWKRKQAG